MTLNPDVSPDDPEPRDYSAKERHAMDDSDFGDPENEAFPIKVPKDVIHAAERLHNAKGDQAAIKERIIAIAKRKGFPLPQTWQDEEKSERQVSPDTSLDPPKEHMTLTAQNKDPIERATTASDVLYYAPITRIDHDRREVIGTATAEVKDAHGTVIGYDASKDAFARWAGNIREMHQGKAVGHALEVTPDDKHKRIIVRARISKGAQDTWEKLLDGTLTGFSIGGRNGKWTEREIGGEKLPFLERYDASELSLVDNPSCPSAKDVAIVRAEGIVDGVLAEEDEAAQIAQSPIERKGATISAATRDGMHTLRDQIHESHKAACANCGCDECQGHMGILGKIDDADGDKRVDIAEIVRAEVAKALVTQLGPVIQRVNALLAYDAAQSPAPDFTRNFTELDTRYNGLTSKLEAIETLVQRIADQPASGGPILHGVDKRLATQGNPSQYNDDAAIIRRATELGFAPPTDPQAAVKAAAALVRPIPRY